MDLQGTVDRRLRGSVGRPASELSSREPLKLVKLLKMLLCTDNAD
jgi:hypothetical protein